MKSIFKNLNVLGLAALIATGVFAISWTEVKEQNLSGLFYEVELINPLQPATDSNLKIKGLYPGANPGDQPGSECEKSNGTLCAIEMNLNGAPIPNTVAEAETLGLVDLRLHREE